MKLNSCFCNYSPSEITEKPNLTWLDAAQVSTNYYLKIHIIHTIYHL